MTTRCVPYLRVSTDEQVEHGFSIPEQRRDCLAYAEREGWSVVDVVVDDGYSGAVDIRPGLDRIRDMAAAGEVDVLLSKKRSRLFRNRRLRLNYEHDLAMLGVRLVCLDDTGNRFGDAMMDEFADWYREEVRLNTAAGRMQKAREGKLIAAYAPIFGFDYTPDRDAYMVVPYRMAVVRRAIETVASRGSINAAKRVLEREGIATPRGGMLWREKTIRQIVLNDAYRPHPFSELEPMLTPEAASRLDPNGEYGVVWYPRMKTRRLDPDPERNYRRPRRESRYGRDEQVPIPVVASGIPREVIDAARLAIRDNRPSRNTGDRVYQLSGILRCADCNYRMATNRNIQNGRTYFYYRCSNHQRHGSKVCAMNKNFPADKLERAVLHTVLDAVKDKDELIRKANEQFERERQRLLRVGGRDAAGWRRAQESLERQRQELFRQAARGRLNDEQLDALVAEVDTEKAHVDRLLIEHEGREERLRVLEEERDRTVRQIREGAWVELGITAPEARRDRYREIGLSAHAHADGAVRLSWGVGGEALLEPSRHNRTYLHYVGLVEDADRALGTDEPVKAALGGEVRVVWVPGEPFEVHDGTPVLDQHASQPLDRGNGAALLCDQALLQISFLEDVPGKARGPTPRHAARVCNAMDCVPAD